MTDQNKGAIAILCSGGPAPGMNAVVSTVAKVFLEDGYTVYGINHGYKTLFTDAVDKVELSFLIADAILHLGGSFLTMSRYKPKDSEFNTSFFTSHNIKLLVTVGGDDTASTANRLAKFLAANNVKMQNIHVPKTIDNDLPLPERIPTFGFHSALSAAATIATTVYEDARTSGNWFVLSSMGREAGHLAYDIAAACHYPMLIIPEMFDKVECTFDRMLRMMISSIVKRKIMGIGYGAICISEGVFHFMSDSEIDNCGITFTHDDHGHPELGNVSKAHLFNTLLGKKLDQLGLNVKTRPVEVGYEVRCVSPIAYDLIYCSTLGNGVKYLFDQGKTGCIVYRTHDGSIGHLSLQDVEDEHGKIKPRLVDIHHLDFRLFVEHMHYITPTDYEKAAQYLPDPQQYDVMNILGWS